MNLFFHSLALERTESIASDLRKNACKTLCMEYDSCVRKMKKHASQDIQPIIDDYQGYAELSRSCALVAHYKVGFFSGLLPPQLGFDALPPGEKISNDMIDRLCNNAPKDRRELETARRLHTLIPDTNLLDLMNSLQMEIQIIMQDMCLYAGREDSGRYAGIIDPNRLSALAP